jgi:LPS O-antigen subunit length determinant protein (WzzB/FepE family)
MSVVDDLKTALRDMLVPDIKAIEVRLSHIEKRLDDAERRATERHNDMVERIQNAVNYAVLFEKVKRLEEQQPQKQIGQ